MSRSDDAPPTDARAARESSAAGDPAARGQAAFATTRWSLVRAAGGDAGSAGRAALATLCEHYWYPLYSYVRRRGHQPAAAQDLTQAFFAHLLERGALAVADADRGRFRSFLLQSLKNFLAAEHRKQTTQKQGGGRRLLSLDFAAGEDRYVREPSDHATPERLFERRWALTLLEQTLAELRGEYESTGRGALFAALEPHLQGDAAAAGYAELAEPLAMSAAAIKAAAHRLRRRYREILRARVAETVGDLAEVDEELHALLAALAN